MSFSPLALALVFFGGGLGSLIRLVLGAAVTERFGIGFPLGTMAINVIGSGLIGLVFVSVEQRLDGVAADLTKLALMTGVLGGFTTFSAFSLDAFLLWQRGAVGLAAAYVIGSVALSIAALAAVVTAAKAAFG